MTKERISCIITGCKNIDGELSKLIIYRFINVVLVQSIMCFALVYIVKYCNTMLDIRSLNSGHLIMAAVTLLMLQIVKSDKVLNYLQEHMYLLLVVSYGMDIAITALLFVSPLMYVILKALYKGTIWKMLDASFSDLTNIIFTGRQRSKFKLVSAQAEYIGIIIGAMTGWFFNDLSIAPIIIIAIVGLIIDVPLSAIRLRIILNRIERLGLKEI